MEPHATILVVDDEVGPRKSLQIILQADYRVLVAAEGAQAIHIVQHEPVAVVLLDVRMPGLSGIQTLEKIKAINPHIEEGKVVSVRGIARDVTERKEMERLKDELVSTVSHELRTPLTSLRGFTELMLKRDFSLEKRREFLTIIHRESVRLTALINDFLDLQRIEAGRQAFNFETQDLVPLLHDTLAVFTHESGKHTLRVQTVDPLPLVCADADRIRQVLTNLLSNALKYSPDGGEVTVGARQDGDQVVVWVADQGIGLPPEVTPKLFTKFFRVDNKETQKIGGTGLGLALVKDIVEAHKG